MEAFERFDVRFLELNAAGGFVLLVGLRTFLTFRVFFFGGCVIAKVAGLW